MPLDLNQILAEHRLWFETRGCEGVRARLQGVRLEGMDFSGAVLVEALFQGADLSRSNFIGADLRGANLQDARLTGARLEGANLEEADLMWSDLREANLQGARLGGTYLQGADLSTVRGLTFRQIDDAVRDGDTLLPPLDASPESFISRD